MKKLNLNKEVIAKLNDDNMNHIVGGDDLMITQTTGLNSCVIGRCPPSCGLYCDTWIICPKEEQLHQDNDI